MSKAYRGDLQMIDSSSIRVHQHAANVKKRGPKNADISTSGDVTATRCMGRSRGGITTKIHAVVDADGNPIRLKLSEGQAHDGRSATDMLESIGPGQTLLADRGYDSDALRQKLADRGAWANVKPMPGRVNIPAFSPYLYRFRKLVERFFNKLKHFRTIATRYEKHDANYLALVKLAAARIWMRFMGRSPSLRTPSSIYKKRKHFVYGIGSVTAIILMVAADDIIMLVPILQSLADVDFEGMMTEVAE